jgi:tetratricopeptide (TPR) repeat protein
MSNMKTHRSIGRLRAVLLAAAVTAVPAAAQHDGHGAPRAGKQAFVPLYNNLGNLRYDIGTRVAEAQEYFNQGLRLTYALNHAEAIASFQRAAELDSTCAMCHWGIALASGPNINAQMDSAGAAAAQKAVRAAEKRMKFASERQQAFIRALAVRYDADPALTRKQLDTAYAKAMQEIVARYPADPEARVLYAEALMVLSPWNYWTGKEARPGTDAILSNLTNVTARLPEHPGACHYFIHAVEAAFPERAVECAERLAKLMPGAGHLVHMPGHIYIRVGRYLDAIRANEHAVHADEGWIRDRRPGLGSYTAGYYPHNYDFLAFAASLAGIENQAVDAAERVASLVPRELLGAPGLTYLQNYATRSLQVRVRFSRWNEILAHPAPAANLPYARAIWHYARGRAFVATGKLELAMQEVSRFRQAAGDSSLKDATVEFNKASAVLAIARDVLEGHIAQLGGDPQRAVELLRAAAANEDALTYGEPPEWTVPVRHDLGEILLAQGRAREAAAVYREDLERFPKNGWALKGLKRSR